MYSKIQTEHERRGRRAQQSCLQLSNSTSNKGAWNKSCSPMIDEEASRLEMNINTRSVARSRPGCWGGSAAPTSTPSPPVHCALPPSAARASPSSSQCYPQKPRLEQPLFSGAQNSEWVSLPFSSL